MKEFGPPSGARISGAPFGSANAQCRPVGCQPMSNQADMCQWSSANIYLTTVRNVFAAKVIFSQASVILFMGAGGGVWQTPPPRQIPLPLDRHSPGQTSPRQISPWTDNPSPRPVDGMHPAEIHSCYDYHYF